MRQHLNRASSPGQDGGQWGWVPQSLARRKAQYAQGRGGLVGHLRGSHLPPGQEVFGTEPARIGRGGLATGVRQSQAGACLKGVRPQGHWRSEKAEEKAGDLAVP